MSLFSRRDDMPNGSMSSGPTSYEPLSVTPAPEVRAAEEVETKASVEQLLDETPSVEEATPKNVKTNTAPIPVQSPAEAPLLYDERLHIKYMFTFYSGPAQVFLWVIVAIIIIPSVLSLFTELQKEWAKLEEIPVLGIIARVIRVIVVTVLESLWGVVSSLIAKTGAVGVIVAFVAAILLLLVLAVLVIRPIYAWRISRVQVGFDRVVLLRPGNKYLFLNDDTIRIKDTSIIRGVTEGVLAFDRWIFPGAGIVTIDKDDLGGRGDDKPWEPVRKYEQLVEAVGTVIQYHKTQQNRA